MFSNLDYNVIEIILLSLRVSLFSVLIACLISIPFAAYLSCNSFLGRDIFIVSILFENDPHLNNQYGIIKIDPNHCKNINHAAADIFYEWILSSEGQNYIAEYLYNGEFLFKPGSIEYNK
tara:strand:- start:282 stop:641 length:360 start_codon:yes stop_codon:yes gene_type:complete